MKLAQNFRRSFSFSTKDNQKSEEIIQFWFGKLSSPEQAIDGLNY